jgi:hypothetical protein
MLKRAAIAFALAALIGVGTVPGADGCALATPHDHPCCSEARPQKSPSCCSVGETPTLGTIGHDVHCNCIHVPNTPATAAASGDSAFPDTHASSDRAAAVLAGTGPRAARGAAVVAGVRSHPAPPAFLLDCAFLT